MRRRHCSGPGRAGPAEAPRPCAARRQEAARARDAIRRRTLPRSCRRPPRRGRMRLQGARKGCVRPCRSLPAGFCGAARAAQSRRHRGTNVRRRQAPAVPHAARGRRHALRARASRTWHRAGPRSGLPEIWHLEGSTPAGGPRSPQPDADRGPSACGAPQPLLKPVARIRMPPFRPSAHAVRRARFPGGARMRGRIELRIACAAPASAGGGARQGLRRQAARCGGAVPPAKRAYSRPSRRPAWTRICCACRASATQERGSSTGRLVALNMR